MGLMYDKKDIYSTLSQEELDKVDVYSKEYIDFLNSSKTERLCVDNAIKLLNENGFCDITNKKSLKAGDRVYFINKQKSIFATVIGQKDLIYGTNIIGSHIDSPRLDLKPMPLSENHDIAILKTQYYGGIKKYQWMSIPLAMYGVIFNEKGEKKNIAIGDTNDDTCFTIADLLPHLAKDQMKANANEFIDPEKMSIIIGNIKDKEAKDHKVKEAVLKILNKKYGIQEIDFARSEIELVPAFDAKFVGIDRSMIGGYGQDDRVCSYANLRSLIDLLKENQNFDKTVIAMIVDKEEIGSVGNTSMSSQAFDMFINILLQKTGSKADRLNVYYNSKMLSADVATAVDPDYDEVSDIQNSNILGCGVALEKYSGSGGKYNSSDANAEFMSEIMQIFDKNKVMYQIGTLGKIEKGGGGTIAYILADKGVDVVDCGTAVLAMHSPYEVASKFDVYMTYLSYKAFFQS
ncbi:MAG: aminopeptidase [Clostridia bacterium]|nr:aminopeptidase [Clostridia bacterium]